MQLLVGAAEPVKSPAEQERVSLVEAAGLLQFISIGDAAAAPPPVRQGLDPLI